MRTHRLGLVIPVQRTIAITAVWAIATLMGCDGTTSTATDGGVDMTASTNNVKILTVPVSETGHDRFFGTQVDSAGNIFAVGVVADGITTDTDYRLVLAKFTSSGVLDSSFGNGGIVTKNVVVGTNGEVFRGIVIQSTGNIVVGGTVEHVGASDARDRDIALVRYTAGGVLDETFGDKGVKILNLSDGEIVGSTYTADAFWGLALHNDDGLIIHGGRKRVGGTDSDYVIARLTANGALDENFATKGTYALDINNRNASPRNVIVLADNSIVAGGYVDDGGVVKPVIIKLKSTGEPDDNFGTKGVFSQTVLAAATEVYTVVQQGTAFVTAGYGRASGTESLDWLSIRVSATGTFDNSYGTEGVTRIDIGGLADNARNAVMLPNNRLLMIGAGRPTENNVDGALAILQENGRPDTTFAPKGFRTIDLGGPNDHLWSGAVSASKSQVVLVGIKGATMGDDDDAVIVIVPFSQL